MSVEEQGFQYNTLSPKNMHKSNNWQIGAKPCYELGPENEHF